MPALRRIILQHRLYFILFFLWLTAALIFISTGSKTDSFLKLNLFHNPVMDTLLSSVTFLGDGLFSIFVSIIILIAWRNQRCALQAAVAFITSGIFAQILKNIVKAPRPKEIIDPLLVNHFSTAIKGAGWDSFPSGHTTSIFALVTILILHINDKRFAFLLLPLAIAVGYSRIYIGSHFPADVIAGAILGTVAGLLVHLLLHNFGKRSATKNTMAPSDDLYNSQLAGNQ